MRFTRFGDAVDEAWEGVRQDLVVCQGTVASGALVCSGRRDTATTCGRDACVTKPSFGLNGFEASPESSHNAQIPASP